MKFLSKYQDSEILEEDLKYLSTSDNTRLRIKLLAEQRNFCAYTEKYITKIDSIEIEHFNPSKKNNDDYYNYYSTLRYANENKISKYALYQHSVFFQDLFFQDLNNFQARITYDDFSYNALDEADQDAKDLINYLGFNDDYLFDERMKHIERLKFTLQTFTAEQKVEYFAKHKNDLSYITAIEYEFNINLSEIIND